MLEPRGFGANPETAADNLFQRPAPADSAPLAALAASEFQRLRAALEAAGVEVVVPAAPVAAEPAPPDAVFPNNWFSTHPGGRLVLYPMKAVSRRAERRPDVVAWLRERYPLVDDLTPFEAEGRFLEGTGSLVIDERACTVYAATSARTDPGLVAEWGRRLGFTPVVFSARDRAGREIYHTNVPLSVGTAFAVVCTAATSDPVERAQLLTALAAPGRELIDISYDQLEAFCGNILELQGTDGPVVAMSTRAWNAFSSAQRAALAGHAEVVHADLETIETYGGGSARCMLAELF
ncbi:MAG: arginine deiminase-related protein [Gemmatimonadota bacterium]